MAKRTLIVSGDPVSVNGGDGYMLDHDMYPFFDEDKEGSVTVTFENKTSSEKKVVVEFDCVRLL